MLTVISPAKRLDWSPMDMSAATEPKFKTDANALVRVARELSAEDLQKLMSISPDLAHLNVDRFKTFRARPTVEHVKPAAFAFAGDTYLGLEASTLDQDDVRFAQDHLRILSGLYGLLRPLDMIQPYRLEMGSRLANKNGKNLYDYWGKRLARALNAEAKERGVNTLLNCASQEYFGAVDQSVLKLRLIEPVFLERKDGGEKIVSFFAKKARGAMARFAVERRLNSAEGLKDFDSGGYEFQPNQSSDNRLVFSRDYQPPK